MCTWSIPELIYYILHNRVIEYICKILMPSLCLPGRWRLRFQAPGVGEPCPESLTVETPPQTVLLWTKETFTGILKCFAQSLSTSTDPYQA